MAKLIIPSENGPRTENSDFTFIKNFLHKRGIFFEQWQAKRLLNDQDSNEMILEAYAHELKPFMQKHGYVTSDVINVHAGTPNIEAIRAKFLSEHTHSEDEIRFFVDGAGLFWFHLGEEAFALKCVAGDFLSVPKGFKHWFDLAPEYHVKAIRIFSNQEGWVANYTNSGFEKKFNQ